jgi:Uma2 family endonuclease
VTQELRTQVSPSHFRVPDVLVMRSDAPFEEIVKTPPLLCVEVLSPDDRMVDMQDKIDDYLAMGVAAIWVVNPRSRKAFVVDRGALIPVSELTVAGTEISVSVDQVFAQLNELEGESGRR